ncbi:uncharacterized protein LOC144433362 [Glandiceps talaboti]
MSFSCKKRMLFRLSKILTLDIDLHRQQTVVRNRAKENQSPEHSKSQMETQYDHQVIAVMEKDKDVELAARFLYDKHPKESTMVRYDQETGRFNVIQGKLQDLGRKSRIQVVGHGKLENGEMKMSGMTGRELAGVLRTLPISENDELGRISLVGCNIGESSVPDNDKVVDRPFLSELIRDFKTNGIKTTVSARTTLLRVASTGQKITAEITPDGIEWHHKDASKKVIAMYDDIEGTVTFEEQPFQERKVYIDNTKDTVRSLGDLEEGYVIKYSNGKPVKFSVITGEKMDEFVSSVTKLAFPENNKDDFLNRYIEDEIRRGELSEKFKGASYVIHEGHRVTVKLVSGNKEDINVGAAIKDIEVYRPTESYGMSSKMTKVRHIENYQQYLDEVQWLGLTGVSNKHVCEYYRFGYFVLSMDLQNFYITKREKDTYAGFVASDDESKKIIKKYDSSDVISSLKKANNNMDIAYARFKKSAKLSYLISWMNGKNSEVPIHLAPRDAMQFMALSISETVRRFRTHATNLFSFKLYTKRVNKFLKDIDLPGGAANAFYEDHPMAQGGSWKNKKGTGFEESNQSSEEKVYPKELDVTRRMLVHQKSKVVDGSKYVIYDKSAFDYESTDLQVKKEDPNLWNEVVEKHLEEFQPKSKSKQHTPTEKKPPSFSGVLGENIESLNRMAMEYMLGSAREASIRSLVAFAEDNIAIRKKVDIAMKDTFHDESNKYKVIEETATFKDGMLEFSVVNENEPAKEKTVSVEINQDDLASKKLIQQSEEHLSNLEKEPTGGVSHKISYGLGAYGIVMGFKGAVDGFENGQTAEATMALLQSVHGLGSLTSVDSKIGKIIGKTFGHILNPSLNKLTTTIGRVAGEEFSEIGGKIMKIGNKLRLFSEDIPLVGVAFGIYNIEEDIRQHTAIGYIDAGLDTLITGLDMLGPEAEPVVIVLTIFRLGIDQFYNSIKKEFDALPPDASTGAKMVAFFKGVGNAFIHFDLTPWGQIINAIDESRHIEKQYEQDRETLRDLSDYHKYFKVEKEKDSGAEAISFTDGSESWNGGDIEFTLNNDGTATLHMDEIVDENGNQRSITKTFQIDNDVRDIIVGIGESHSVSFRRETAHFLLFIPVFSRNIIDGFEEDKSSLHGTYYGNSDDNRFFTVQSLPDGSKLDYSLGEYFYRLYGKDGKDNFFLGPQKSYVCGGAGQDAYIIPEHGGDTIIDNYALDNADDILFLDVDYKMLWTERHGEDLVFIHSIDNRNVRVQILQWFTDIRHQHLIFKAQDVVFQVNSNALGAPRSQAIAIDRSDKTEGQEIDATSVPYNSVIMLTGSDHSDKIYGNDKANRITGNKGDDDLVGGDGADVYVINEGDGNDTIENYAQDEATDMLMFGVKYNKIQVDTDGQSVSICSYSNHLRITISTCSWVNNWFRGVPYQHLIVLSSDGVGMQIKGNSSENLSLVPVMIDYEDKPGSTINLTANPDFKTVVTVVGSRFDDIIIGNSLGNFINGQAGADFLSGGLGADVYIVHADEDIDTIDNFAIDLKQDVLLLNFTYDSISVRPEDSDAAIYTHQDISNTYCMSLIVKVKNWFAGKLHQHLVVRTIDGVDFMMPLTPHDWPSVDGKIPLTLDFTKKGRRGETVDLDASNENWKTVLSLIGSEKADTNMYGNDGDNNMQGGFGGYMEGKNGSDTYVPVNGTYAINNYAEDLRQDILKFDEYFSRMDFNGPDDTGNVVIAGNNSLEVHLRSFAENDSFQHLITETKDGISFVLSNDSYTPEPFKINRINSHSGQEIDLAKSNMWSLVQSVYGSNSQQNYLHATAYPCTLVGGDKVDNIVGNSYNDVLRGGKGQNLLDGQLGNDTIIGGPDQDWIIGGLGDDLLYPGDGADIVNGDLDTDTVLFVGDIMNETGVYVDLLLGQGMGADAEGDVYIGVENVIGSDYDDIIVGGNDDNVLNGMGGRDILLPNEGYDILIGGDDADIYALEYATGPKMVNNAANDDAIDAITLTDRHSSNLYYQRHDDHLVVRFGTKYMFGDWCLDGDTMLVLADWFAGMMYYYPFHCNVRNYKMLYWKR